ncbi:nucleotidyl transferase AbiEii/AbiGii toxin family protein [Hydrogenimonas sp. SS33]|uniref:nucleotidyl transferase AbiEii/AbiGii toxin family protein n=1 Tax=Hydrogenimonas leucolamina TaxID=2954236 RepID=UPI00336BB024
MINRQTKSVLQRFSKIPLFEEHRAILIGGTALAYHLGHRESFDLDICFPFAEALPPLAFLEEFDEVIPIAFDQGIIDTAINEGGDIEEVMQRYIVDGVKVDFVINPSSNIYESEILQNDEGLRFGTLRIASIDAVFKLKSLLLLDRNKVRDLYDIVYLLRERDFQGKQILDTIRHYRITYLPKHIIQLIEAKEEDPFDMEGIENPKMDLTEYDELKTYLLQAILKE